VVLVHDECGQRPRHAGRRRAQLRAAPRRRAAAVEGRRGRGGRPAPRGGRDEAGRRLEPALQVLRQPGPIPHHMHQSDEDAARVGRRGKPEAYYFPPQYNQLDNDFPLYVHGPRARDDQGGHPAVSRELEQGRQRDPVPLSRVQAATGNRMADRSRHPARSGVARHLRTAGEQRRVRDVSIRGRRAHHRLEPLDQGRAERAPPRSRLHHRHARLGREREP
jgi:hypothetical protein